MKIWIATVLIFRGVNRYFRYKIPLDFLSIYKIGQTVIVPFGPSEVKGLIVNIEPNEDEIPLKNIIKKDEKSPQISQSTIDLICWFSTHHNITPFQSFSTIVGKRKILKKESDSILDPINPSRFISTSQQNKAIQKISELSDGFSETLLHGVTGSGKTEVYMQLIEKVRLQNKSVILLIPEIALTPQYTQRFTEKFGNQFGVIHSNLTPAQRNKVWNEALNGKKTIIMGPRSAIFTPMSHIGLIIIDEAHDLSYKQDQQPRYWTIDVAQFLAKYHQCKLVYGTATPSVEMLYQVKNNEIHYATLSERVHQNPLPKIFCLDSKEIQAKEGFGLLCKQVVSKIETCINKNEKIIVLLNRRGYAVYVACRKCKHVLICPECNLSLVYHQDRKYRCHRCSLTFPFTLICPKCKKPELALLGTGLQKVETELKRYFPTATLVRLDRDTASNLSKMDEILTLFREKGDILLGTQMIAKGHDIPQVTLVVVLGIDTALNLPDFSAPERAFQLLTQVAGRAGRGSLSGEVYTQTAYPEHYAIISATQHDCWKFYEKEIHFRNQLHYPPFSKLIHIIFSSENKETVKNEAQEWIKKFPIDSNVKILGPSPAPLEKILNTYRWHALFKIEPIEFEKIKKKIIEIKKPAQGVKIFYDFSPKSVL